MVLEEGEFNPLAAQALTNETRDETIVTPEDGGTWETPTKKGRSDTSIVSTCLDIQSPSKFSVLAEDMDEDVVEDQQEEEITEGNLELVDQISTGDDNQKIERMR